MSEKQPKRRSHSGRKHSESGRSLDLPLLPMLDLPSDTADTVADAKTAEPAAQGMADTPAQPAAELPLTPAAGQPAPEAGVRPEPGANTPVSGPDAAAPQTDAASAAGKQKKPRGRLMGALRSRSFRSALGASYDKSKLMLLIYCIYAVVCLIIGVFLSLSQSVPAFFGINNIMSAIYGAFSNIDIIGLALGLLAAIQLFGKYKSKSANDVFHSIAVKDTHLFWADYLIGLVTFLVPMLIGLLAQTGLGMVIESFETSKSVFEAFGMSFGLIFNFVFSYSAAVLCLSMTNTVLEGSIGFIAVNFIPMIINTFYDFFHSAILGLHAMPEVEPALKMETTLSLLSKAMNAQTEAALGATYWSVVIVGAAIFVLSGVLAVLGYLAFIKLRTHDSFDSKVKTVVSQLVVIFLAFYVGFLVLFFKRDALSGMNMLAILITMLAAGFVVYFLIHTMLSKSFRLPVKRFAPYLAAAVGLIVFGAYYFSGGFGAVQYLPETADIESVTFNYVNGSYQQQLDALNSEKFSRHKYLARISVTTEFPITYSDEQSIALIHDYHAALLEGYEADGYLELAEPESSGNFPGAEGSDPQAIISYKLKNGKTVTRYYNRKDQENAAFSALEALDCFGNSVTSGESRAIDYINRAPLADVYHKLYLFPILPDGDYSERFDLTDEQMQGLIRAIYEDEQSFDDDAVLASPDGDVCVLNISPNESEQGYFADMIPFTGTSTRQFIVKSCYTRTAEYLRYELGLGRAIDQKLSPGVVQLSVGDPSAFQLGWGRSRYTYDFDQLYKYNAGAVTTWYLDTALQEQGVTGMPSVFTERALSYLVSRMRLSTDNLYNGKIVLTSRVLNLEPSYGSEEILFGDQRLYFVTNEEWEHFLSLCQ